MKISLIIPITVQLLFLPLISCQTTPYLPSQQPVIVENVKVNVTNYYGRPDIFLDIKGRLSSNAAQLVDIKQARGRGNLLLIQVNEQTVRGGSPTNRLPNPPFQTRVPLEVLGLEPGMTYMIDANGSLTEFVMPESEPEEPETSTSTTGFEFSSY